MFNQQAEQAIIGNIILNNNKLDAVDFLEPEHFYFEQHQKLFKHLRNCILHEERRQDAVTIRTFFSLEKSMQEVGGINYLGVILEAAGYSVITSTKDYAKEILTLWQKREFFNAIESLDKSMTLEEIKNELETKFDALELQTSNQPAFVNSLMKDFVLRKVENKEVGDLINLNYKKLDEILRGLYPANLVTLAGKTSMGKTAFALNLAKTISATTKDREGVPTFFLSIEMKTDEVLGRFLVEMASINGYRLRNAQLKPMEEQAALIAKNNCNMNLLLDDSSGLTVIQIWSKVKKIVNKYGVKVVIIDYLQKIIPLNSKDSRERQIGMIVEKLKDMAKKLDVVVILLSQLSRENEKRPNKRPLLSDLRDSGSIEQESDVVMFVHRDDYYLEKEKVPEHHMDYQKWLAAYNQSKGMAYILIAKNRNGVTGESEMFFDKEFQRFTEINQRGKNDS